MADGKKISIQEKINLLFSPENLVKNVTDPRDRDLEISWDDSKAIRDRRRLVDSKSLGTTYDSVIG